MAPDLQGIGSMNANEYEKALNEMRTANEVYSAALASFRKGAISDAEYLRARATKAAASAAFDVAFEARVAQADDVVADDSQGSLF